LSDCWKEWITPTIKSYGEMYKELRKVNIRRGLQERTLRVRMYVGYQTEGSRKKIGKAVAQNTGRSHTEHQEKDWIITGLAIRYGNKQKNTPHMIML
jgi:hypothetical protein